MALAGILGMVLSFLLQVLKRWYTFTPEAVKGLVVIACVIYAVVIAVIKGSFSFLPFIADLGTMLIANQAFFAMVLNNTDAGYKIAGITTIWDK